MINRKLIVDSMDAVGALCFLGGTVVNMNYLPGANWLYASGSVLFLVGTIIDMRGVKWLTN